ncbi:hypothetical protein LTS18_007926 [Coniosporium uncinatum]|uniref:Uncharacterized protein n=1 Tax=Coniosporium uncinatum TaxID=93489 RepID=A0ACC3D280_9PEZI|nr:hypothetical protein LTS18_007926 [Coniosporium uncinatum]
MAMENVAQPSNLYQQLDQYDWDADEEFQGGLSAILGPDPAPEQAAELALRARKFNVPVDFDQYKAWRESRLTPSNTTNGLNPSASAAETPQATPVAISGASPEAPYPTSFSHIVELITTGQPVPGIKEIPNTVLEGQGTESAKPRRKKPWEQDESTTSAATETA